MKLIEGNDCFLMNVYRIQFRFVCACPTSCAEWNEDDLGKVKTGWLTLRFHGSLGVGMHLDLVIVFKNSF